MTQVPKRPLSRGEIFEYEQLEKEYQAGKKNFKQTSDYSKLNRIVVKPPASRYYYAKSN